MTTKSTAIEAGREQLRLMRKSSNRMKSVLTAIIEPHGITAQQFLALLWIRDREGLSQVELSSEIDSDVNTVSAMIRRLDKKGLVIRMKHSTDGRAICLFPTEQGKQLVDQLRPAVDQLGQRVLALVPQEHAAIITDWLKATSSLPEPL